MFVPQVLKRRLARAGGDASDEVALQQLLATFSDPMRLPAAVRGGKPSSSSSSNEASGGSELENAAAAAAESGSAGGSVAKGAMLVFERSGAVTVTARVSPHILGAVHSPKLAEALFDLYLGDQPVSKTAKDAAAQTLNRIAAGSSISSNMGASSGSSSGGSVHYLFHLPQGKSEEIKCEGQAIEGLKGKGGLSKGGLGLG
jgi:hypothetical protein